jgi:hypothetical protein
MRLAMFSRKFRAKTNFAEIPAKKQKRKFRAKNKNTKHADDADDGHDGKRHA